MCLTLPTRAQRAGHHDNTFADLNNLKQQVGTDPGFEVRLLTWY